ncbi:glycosyltransferase [Flavobacterium sp. 17A]|uniref:Glycosyltransferase n=1 Tax=Flavobacterium potami TaxID=2872310 RepID=A0A9X1HBY9_9FLAO|nr:glycosyltransferase family 2 protein [Flavobacterium potami]MBZ4036539.1 glycosyltransferase [Flavobacterium potami]
MNTESPKISIITVVFNGAKTIEETIKSVIAQNCKECEYIIIDGGSTDGTLDIIRKYEQHISFWISEPDKGIYNAMNKGVIHANGEFIYFIGADDVFYDDKVLEKILPILIGNYVFYGNVIFKSRNIFYDGKFSSYKLATRNISHQSIFYPKHVLVKNKFKEIYNIFADYELNIRLYYNYQFKYVPLLIALFDDSGVSGSNTVDVNFEKNRLRIIKKYFSSDVFIYRKLRSYIAKKIRHE